MDQFKKMPFFSSQQEQNSARWIKEQEETQNIEPSSVFYDNGMSNTAVRIEGYLFKRSHQKVCSRCSLRVLRPVIKDVPSINMSFF